MHPEVLAFKRQEDPKFEASLDYITGTCQIHTPLPKKKKKKTISLGPDGQYLPHVKQAASVTSQSVSQLPRRGWREKSGFGVSLRVSGHRELVIARRTQASESPETFQQEQQDCRPWLCPVSLSLTFTAFLLLFSSKVMPMLPTGRSTL